MRRLLLVAAVLAVLGAPTMAGAGECHRLAISQCEWGGSVEASGDGMALSAETSGGLLKLSFHAPNGTLRVEAMPGRDGGAPTVKLYFRSGGTRAEGTLDLAAAASGDFSSVAPIARYVDPSFLAAADSLLESLPKAEVVTRATASLGRAVTASLGGSSAGVRTLGIRWPIMYSTCYWACVIGSGEWQECGDLCYKQYGPN